MAARSLSEIIKEFKENYGGVMNLADAATDSEIEAFETNNEIKLPEPLKALYKVFNGGEIFTPGTEIFGLDRFKYINSIRYENRRDVRRKYSISSNYIIIAKYNFGDLVCMNLNDPYDIIQWDHEADEQFFDWETVEEWLEDQLLDYIDFLASEDAQ